MERLDSKFHGKYTALKVPRARPLLPHPVSMATWPASGGLTLQLLFPGSMHRRDAEEEAAVRGAGAEAGGGAQGAL